MRETSNQDQMKTEYQYVETTKMAGVKGGSGATLYIQRRKHRNGQKMGETRHGDSVTMFVLTIS